MKTTENSPRRREDAKKDLYRTTVKAKGVFCFGVIFTLFFLLNIPTALHSQTPTPAVSTAPNGDAQSLFAKAQGYFNQKNYDQARTALSHFVAEHPLDQMIPQAKLLLARMEEDFTASTQQFAQLAKDYADKPEGAEAQKDLGARYYLADKYSEAAQTYEDFLKTHPESSSAPEARYWYACSLFSLEHYQMAVTQFAQVADKTPESPWAPKSLLGLGNTYVKLNLDAQAEKQYLLVLDRYPLFTEMNLVYYRLGRVYELEGKNAQAHAAYASLVGQFPRALETEDALQRMQAMERLDPSLTPVAAAAVPTPTVPSQANEETPAASGSMTLAGVSTPVESSTTEEDAQSDETESAATPFHIQVGVYSRTKFMTLTLKTLEKAGYKPKILKVKTEDMAYALYKVRVGDYPDRASAQKAAKALTKKTRLTTFVVED
jgi:tol-pal system protein YbgF